MKTLRVILSAFVLMLAVTVSTQAVPRVVNADSNTEVQAEPIKKQIDPAQLPAAVKSAITGGEYAEWSITKAYKVTSEKDPEMVTYEVHFANAEEQQEVVSYDKDGKEI